MTTILQSWFDRYAEHHRNTFNKKVHIIFVPLIFFSVLGLMAMIHFPISVGRFTIQVRMDYPLIALVLFFYMRHSIKIFLGVLFYTAVCLIGIHFIHLQNSIPAMFAFSGIFVFSWIAQFFGHKIEGRKPSFLTDIVFLLIGPAWIIHLLFGKIGSSRFWCLAFLMTFVIADTEAKPQTKNSSRYFLMNDGTRIDFTGIIKTTEDSIYLFNDSVKISLAMDSIAEYHYHKSGKVGRGILIGSLSGALVGGIIGNLAYKPPPVDNSNLINNIFSSSLDETAKTASILEGALIGTLIGGTIGGVAASGHDFVLNLKAYDKVAKRNLLESINFNL